MIMRNTVTMIPVAALMAIEKALNATLALDPAVLQRLARLEGRVIAIDIQGTGMTVHLAPAVDGLRLLGHYDGEVDTTLRGTPLALMRLSAAKSGEGLFSGEITIEGDVETGQQLQKILQGLDIDWEEHLSRITGDAIGHQIGNTVRDIAALGKTALGSLGLNIGEYLQEERRIVPAPAQVGAFIDDVDSLRMAADRLEARIKRLHHALHDSTDSPAQ